MNPGDSFDIPDDMRVPKVLLVPIAAPWCKLAEVADYIRMVRPEIAMPVHNALLSDLGNSIYNKWLEKVCEEIGTQFVPLAINDEVEI